MGADSGGALLLRLIRLRRLRNAFFLRGLMVWVGMRLAASYAGITHPNVLEAGWILGVVALAVFFDAKRRGEDLLLANLGIPGWAMMGVALPAPFFLEILL